MGNFIFARQGIFGSWIAAGVLALLSGCMTLPPPALVVPPQSAQPLQPLQPEPAPLSVALPEVAATAPAQLAEPAPATEPAPLLQVLEPLRSRIADFIARRLPKKADKSAINASSSVAEAPAEPETPVDEKYRLTGEAARELERGHASWYGGQFHGRRTASGENYNKYALTAAHKTLPFGTIVRVRSLKLGREVEVRINDRGPYARGRVIDVSQAAAEALGLTAAGVAEVSLNVSGLLDGVIVRGRPVGKIQKNPRQP